jgi:hypothetical protein
MTIRKQAIFMLTDFIEAIPVPFIQSTNLGVD